MERLRAYLYGAVVRVQQQLGQSHDLRRAVPAVGAVHQDRPVVSVHGVDDQQGGLQQQRQMLQPLGALQRRQPAEDTDVRLGHTHTSEDIHSSQPLSLV